jgi:hypothetical protein
MVSAITKPQNRLNLLTIPFYPVLLAIYSVLFLYSVNLGQVPFSVILRPLALSTVATIAVTLICIAVDQKKQKCGLIAGWFLLLFFIYGHVYDLISGRTILGMQIGYLKPLLAFGILAVIGIVIFSRIKFDLSRIIKFLNLAMSVLILVTAIQIAYYHIVAAQREEKTHLINLAEQSETAPDIYYIVLDSYARNDVLLNDYKFDNTEFTNTLVDKGFYLPECANSNYFGTSISIASSLNMQYLDELGFSTEVYSKDDPPELQQVIHHSELRNQLEELNYVFIAFKGFFPTNDIQDADYYFEVFADEEQSVTISSLSLITQPFFCKFEPEIPIVL